VTKGRRLDQSAAAAALDAAAPIPVNRGASPVLVATIAGHDLQGKPVELLVTAGQPRRLLLFVKTDCHGCADLLDAAVDPSAFGLDASDELVVIFGEDLDVDLRQELAGLPALRSDDAWVSYHVSGAPFFSFVDPALSTVRTEGVAWGVDSVRRAIEASLSGHDQLDVGRLEA